MAVSDSDTVLLPLAASRSSSVVHGFTDRTEGQLENMNAQLAASSSQYATMAYLLDF